MTGLVKKAFGIVGLVWLLAACGGGVKILHYKTVAGQVWPPPPAQARFQYIGQLHGESDFRASSADGLTLIKALKWVVGGLLGSARKQALQRPQSGAVDAQGRIYVSDVNLQAVFVFDSVAGQLHKWQWASLRDQFQAPIGLVLTKQRLYVADAQLGYVAILDIHTGEPIGRIAAQTQRPTGLALDRQRQQLYVADTRQHRIGVFALDGRLLRTIGSFGNKAGELNGPTYLAYDQDRLYVADTLNARIQVYSHAGTFIRQFGRRGKRLGELTRPKGIAIDHNGLVYVVESFYDHLLVFDKKGRFLLAIGGEGSAAGEFYLPAGVWVDKQNIYVADMFNRRVVVLKYLEGV